MLNQNGKMDRRSIGLIVGLYGLFLINEFWLDRISNGTTWVITDLSLRLAVLVILWLRFGTHIVSMINIRPSISWLVYIVAVSILVIAYDVYAIPALSDLFPDLMWSVGAFPGYDGTVVHVLDLSLGLVLVAVGEEVLNRGFARHIYDQYFTSRVGLVLVSAGVFTLMHWGQGVVDMSTAFVAGILLMITYLRTGSLVPGIVSHYLINFYFYI